ncbi:2-phosphosulfolactate phosphatase [Microbacterium sp. MPKO10]|uniref:2-phosphosulfolactate phosphatase n=1 Tax=Microbacterium sp. MPKO10 TaxID=2989818 RepID=UPI0022369A6B|nr:2-phosphosulfolactate phosphatase [Microbacterium sp. MPKO10]MCW4458752.1 2-phosphosulfolactate phosphatase [Microbacterium sp. MPKO10]
MSTAGQQQQRYEVRFEWGSAGLDAIAEGVGAVVVVQGIAGGHPIATAIEAHGRVRAEDWVVDVARTTGARVFAASLRNRTAVAKRVLQHQVDRGDRVRVALVGATAQDAGGATGVESRGAADPDGDAAESAGAHAGAGGSGFAVDVLFATGAVIDALAAVGIDYASPEAAAASAAFTGLERAVGHLYTASTAGQRLIDRDKRDAVVAAGKVDASELVPVLGDDGYWSAV